VKQDLCPYRDAQRNCTWQRPAMPKMAREALANSSARQYSYADEIGITDLSQLKIHQFRDRN
jgi:hypothetical protein